MKQLEKFGPIPLRHELLQNLLSGYGYPDNKILSLVRSGTLIRLKRGLYIVSPAINNNLIVNELIANHLLGPSYVSMETALSHYGLIPERVFSTVSLTTSRSKQFNTPIGYFKYIQTTADYFAIGLTNLTTEGNFTYLIASPEKALCDQLTYTKRLNLSSMKALEIYFADDLRVDTESLKKLDTKIIEQIIQVAKKPKQLIQFLKLLDRRK